MAAPLTDLAHVIRRLFRIARWLSLGIIGVAAIVLVLQVAQIHGQLADVHPLVGHGFLVAVLALVVWLVGVPIARYLRVPVALKPPEMAGKSEEVTTVQVQRRARFLAHYVRSLRKNPLMADSRAEVNEVLKACEAVRGRVLSRSTAEAQAALGELTEFERQRLDPLLKPIDAEVDRVVRREALAVGLGTAVSPNGTLDAFIVLWRNANMVSRIANLYFGRPGARGSLMILRDVSAATLLATYLEGLADAAGSLIGNLLGGIAGTVAGPVIEGGVNSLATLRIGYTARARCRSFKAWTEQTRTAALKAAFAEARRHGKDVIGDVVKGAGGGLAQLPGKMAKAAGGGLSSLWKKVTGEDEEPRPEPGQA
jgi:uncharacterized membrane protein YcjF (UPF0283 family)